MGGADIALIESHGAKSVVGIDITEQLVEAATARAERHGTLGARIHYQLVAPGLSHSQLHHLTRLSARTPSFMCATKTSLYEEIFRILVPGGLLLIGDWLRGDGQQYDRDVEDFIQASGHTFALASLRQIGEICRSADFKKWNWSTGATGTSRNRSWSSKNYEAHWARLFASVGATRLQTMRSSFGKSS